MPKRKLEECPVTQLPVRNLTPKRIKASSTATKTAILNALTNVFNVESGHLRGLERDALIECYYQTITAQGALGAAASPSPFAPRSSPSSAPACSPAGAAASPAIERHSMCWYSQGDSSAKRVKVVSVDRALNPPSYVIRFEDGRERETEVLCLTLRCHRTSTPLHVSLSYADVC